MQDEYIAGLCGEEKLFVAIIQSALEDLQDSDDKIKQKAWRFFINEDDESPNSFVSLCKGLLINPDLILTKVKDYYLYRKPLVRAHKGNHKSSDRILDSNSDLEL